MQVLVVGGSGVLGRTLVPLLTASGHQVTATARTSAALPALRQLGATPCLVDLLDHEAVRTTVGRLRPQAILHVATDLKSGDSASNAHLREVGTRHLVDAACRAEVGTLVAESISWIYVPGAIPAAEDDPLDLNASEPRRTTVRAVDAMERAVAGSAGGVVLRFGQLYGPGTWFSRAGRYGHQARAGLLPATESVTSFVHVTDAARAAALALGWAPGRYNVVDDEPAAGYQWVPAFTAAVGGPAPVRTTTGEPGRPVSNARARSVGFALDFPSWRGGFGP